MDYKRMTAPCGRDCFNCPFYLAKTDKQLRDTFAKRFNVAPEQICCNGCRDSKGNCEVLKIYGFSGACKTYQCISDRNHEFCFECSDFPCSLLQPIADRADKFPHNLKVYNLCRIMNIGLDQWAHEESKNTFERYYKGNLSNCVG
jgi:hypothetical protein